MDRATLGFEGAAATGRPGYHPATLLKLYLYGYMNQVQSSRPLVRTVRCRTVANTLSIGFELRRWSQCSAGKP
ncbi:MAG: transposase [Methylobacterium sp.]|nr:transposase [Methylobacterium sp.]